MPSGKSPRRALPFFETTDAPKFHEEGQLLTSALDNDVEGGQGTLAERPVAKLRGRLYVVQGDATTANNGVTWWDTGSGWLAIQPRLGDGQAYQEITITKAQLEAGYTISAARAVFLYSVAAEGMSEELVGAAKIQLQKLIVPTGVTIKAKCTGASAFVTFLIL